MVRLPHFVILGQPQNVIQRSNSRQDIFRAEDDYRFYLEKFNAAAVKPQNDIHTYALIPNHIHLLITPYVENRIAKLMITWRRYCIQWEYKRLGTTDAEWQSVYRQLFRVRIL